MCLNIWWPNPYDDSEDTKGISSWVEQTRPVLASIQEVSQSVLLIICIINIYWTTHKMHLYLSWTNPELACEDTKCIAFCIDQTHPMPARTQNVFLLPLQARKENVPHPKISAMSHNTYHNMCWPNVYHAIEDSKWIWTCVDLILPCQWEHKLHLNMCCQTPPRLRGYIMHHNMCFRTAVLPTKTQNLSQNVFI